MLSITACKKCCIIKSVSSKKSVFKHYVNLFSIKNTADPISILS